MKKGNQVARVAPMLVIQGENLPDALEDHLEGLELCSSRHASVYSTMRIHQTLADSDLLGELTNPPEHAQCDNCSHVCTIDERTPNAFPEIQDLLQRIGPGATVPSCECPKCHALMFPAPPISPRQSLEDFVAAITGYDYIMVKEG